MIIKNVKKDLISSTYPSLIVADVKIGLSKSMQMTYLLLDYFITYLLPASEK